MSNRPDTGFEARAVELTLPRELPSAARGRAEIRAALRGVRPDAVPVATLLTTELLTNAVVHTAGAREDTIRLLIKVAPDLVRVEVLDTGPGFDPQRPPPQRPGKAGGGLLLVDQLASRWGAQPAAEWPGWFCVWFEMDLGAASRIGAAPND